MLAYFQEHTYLCADSRGAIALANRVAGRQPTKFAAWARAKFALLAAAWKPDSDPGAARDRFEWESLYGCCDAAFFWL